VTATIEIPDPLYQQVVARTARRGEDLRDVTLALYAKWVSENDAVETPAPPLPKTVALARWFRDADAVMGKVPAGPTAREQLRDDRNRLEQ